jgi:hypothetical protein
MFSTKDMKASAVSSRDYVSFLLYRLSRQLYSSILSGAQWETSLPSFIFAPRGVDLLSINPIPYFPLRPAVSKKERERVDFNRDFRASNQTQGLKISRVKSPQIT